MKFSCYRFQYNEQTLNLPIQQYYFGVNLMIEKCMIFLNFWKNGVISIFFDRYDEIFQSSNQNAW